VIWKIYHHSTFVALRRPQARSRSGPITVSYIRLHEAAPHFGFSIPKKVGSAPVRNTVRRRLREIVARNQDKLSGGSYLISVGPGAKDLSFSQLEISTVDAFDGLRGRKGLSSGTRLISDSYTKEQRAR